MQFQDTVFRVKRKFKMKRRDLLFTLGVAIALLPLYPVAVSAKELSMLALFLAIAFYRLNPTAE